MIQNMSYLVFKDSNLSENRTLIVVVWLENKIVSQLIIISAALFHLVNREFVRWRTAFSLTQQQSTCNPDTIQRLLKQWSVRVYGEDFFFAFFKNGNAAAWMDFIMRWVIQLNWVKTLLKWSQWDQAALKDPLWSYE